METSVARFLWKYTKKLKLWCFLVVLTFALATALGRMFNYFSARMVDLIASAPADSQTMRTLLLLSGGIFAAISLQSLVEIAQRLINVRFMPYYLSKVSRDLFSHAHKHSSSFFAEEMAGNIAGKIKNIINNTEQAYFHILYGLLSPVLSFLINIVFIYTVNVELALCFTVITIFFAILMIWLKRKLIPFSERKNKLSSESTGVMVDSITNSDLVKNFSNYLYEKHRYYSSVNKMMKALRTEELKSARIDYAVKVVFDIMTVSFILLVFYYWYAQNISVGGVVLVLSLISSMIHVVANISMFTTRFVQIVGGIRDGLKLLAKPCEVTDKPGAPAITISEADIRINNLNYHYKEARALFENFFLHIRPGEKVGLIGHSGSGKSTLVRLLSRYYDIQGGAILIDGQNIADVTQDSLRRNIALIPQDPSLFHRSIMENIRYGCLSATDEEVFEAARKAYCHDFILKMPQGYNSKVGERGVMLSGGERQRIAIARAILKNAPILILDEATSALDSESEYYIQKSLKSLMKGKTVIAIAHRLSTLKEMDRIVVMDNGKIIEEGTHEALIRKKGAYFGFYNMQVSGFIGETQ